MIIANYVNQLLTKLHIDNYRAIHSLKTAIACLIGLGIFEYFNLPSGQWIPITVMVVMSAQTHFGAALQKAYMRFLGTLGGVSIALLTLTFFDSHLTAIFLVIFIACLFFTYIASGGGNISYAGTLGGVTVILTLTSSQATTNTAMQRGLYIVIGIIIALLVSRFIFPIHARERLRFNIADTLRKLRKLYFHAAQASELKTIISDNLKPDLTEQIAEQPQLIDEASIGSIYFKTHKKKLFSEVVAAERRLNRLVNFMHKSSSKANYSDYLLHKAKDIESLHTTVEIGFDDLATSFENYSSPKKIKEINAAMKQMTLIIEALPKKEAMHQRQAQTLVEEHSFLFFMEQIITEIENLQILAKKIHTKNS